MRRNSNWSNYDFSDRQTAEQNAKQDLEQHIQNIYEQLENIYGIYGKIIEYYEGKGQRKGHFTFLENTKTAIDKSATIINVSLQTIKKYVDQGYEGLLLEFTRKSHIGNDLQMIIDRDTNPVIRKRQVKGKSIYSVDSKESDKKYTWKILEENQISYNFDKDTAIELLDILLKSNSLINDRANLLAKLDLAINAEETEDFVEKTTNIIQSLSLKENLEFLVTKYSSQKYLEESETFDKLQTLLLICSGSGKHGQHPELQRGVETIIDNVRYTAATTYTPISDRIVSGSQNIASQSATTMRNSIRRLSETIGEARSSMQRFSTRLSTRFSMTNISEDAGLDNRAAEEGTVQEQGNEIYDPRYTRAQNTTEETTARPAHLEHQPRLRFADVDDNKHQQEAASNESAEPISEPTQNAPMRFALNKGKKSFAESVWNLDVGTEISDDENENSQERSNSQER